MAVPLYALAWIVDRVMLTGSGECSICRGPAADPELRREQVWQDALWRLTVAQEGEVAGLAYLEPKRHVPHIEDLDGEEARTFGTILARAAAAIREAADAERTYVYIFGGGVPHLHVHLAPHRAGGPLSDRMIRGEVSEQKLPSGATAIVSQEFPPLSEEIHARIRARIRAALRS